MNSSTVPTPAGILTIVEEDGQVRSAGFTEDPGALLGLGGHTPRPRPELGPITRAVRAYLGGDLDAIDTVPVRQPSGGSFIDQVWRTLREVKPGDPVTYSRLAELAQRPRAVRAAAAGCARNAVALFVPCHRIVRLDGGLGGYRWGLPVKRWLLDHEAGR